MLDSAALYGASPVRLLRALTSSGLPGALVLLGFVTYVLIAALRVHAVDPSTEGLLYVGAAVLGMLLLMLNHKGARSSQLQPTDYVKFVAGYLGGIAIWGQQSPRNLVVLCAGAGLAGSLVHYLSYCQIYQVHGCAPSGVEIWYHGWDGLRQVDQNGTAPAVIWSPRFISSPSPADFDCSSAVPLPQAHASLSIGDAPQRKLSVECTLPSRITEEVSERLLTAESSARLQEVGSGGASSIRQLLLEANSEFAELLCNDLIDAGLNPSELDWCNSPSSGARWFARVVHVSAPAGYGKSALFRQGSGLLPSSVSLIVPLSANALKHMSVDEDSLLGHGGYGKMPVVAATLESDFHAFMTALLRTEPECRPFLVIDGIDEMHPKSIPTVLGAVDDYVLHGRCAKTIKRALVVGRPEAFASYWTDTHRKMNSPAGRPVLLNAPKFPETSLPIQHILFDTLCYERKLPDADCAGRFEDSAESTRRVVAEQSSAVARALLRHPFLREQAHTVHGVNQLFLHAAEWAAEEESSVKDRIFHDLLGRNLRSHRRPDAQAREYMDALYTVAADHLAVDEDGYFMVLANEETRTRSGAIFRTTALLDYSGIVLRDPLNDRNARYRFEPMWLHRHLAQQAESAMAACSTSE